MDIMSVKDIFLVGIPETLISLIFGLLLFRNKITKSKRYRTLISYILAIVFILGTIFLSRIKFNSYLIVAIISMVVYIIAFKIQFNLNCRQACVSGGLVLFQLIILEVIVLPIFTDILNLIIENFPFFNMRFIYSLPIRLFQIIIIYIMIKNDINLRNISLLDTEWENLSSAKKITTTVLIILVLISAIFCMNFVELFIKIETNGVNPNIFGFTLKLIQIETIIFSFIMLLILSRTSNYELFKDILYREPQEVFFPILKTMLKTLSNEKRKNLKKLIDNCFDEYEKGGVTNENV